jgi:regulator of cell morphogenesis and NO signaling
MNKLNENMTLKDIVLQNTSYYKILEKYKLDYCCNGKKIFKEACQEKNLNSQKILEELNSFNTIQKEIDLKNLSLSELVDHIEDTHHVFMKKEMPEILALLDKVVNHHKTADLKRLQKIFKILSDDISLHLKKEETILFPAIKELDKYGKVKNLACANKEKNPKASINNPIKQMEAEHEMAGAILSEIDEIINKENFEICTSVKILKEKLIALQEDLHRHIHKENYLLFPNALKKEKH